MSYIVTIKTVRPSSKVLAYGEFLKTKSGTNPVVAARSRLVAARKAAGVVVTNTTSADGLVSTTNLDYGTKDAYDAFAAAHKADFDTVSAGFKVYATATGCTSEEILPA